MKEINAQSPISVANFIIELANKHNLPVTNLQLQKIFFTRNCFHPEVPGVTAFHIKKGSVAKSSIMDD